VSHAPIGQMRAESCEERHARRVDADLKRAGEDQCLMRRSDRCGQRAVRRSTPGGWMLTLHTHTPYIRLSKPSLSTCPPGACVSGKTQSQHVSSGGVRVRVEEGQPGPSSLFSEQAGLPGRRSRGEEDHHLKRHPSEPSLSTCPPGACVLGQTQSQHVSSGGVRVP